MVRTKALTDAEIASGMGRTKPLVSRAILEQSRSGPGSRGLTIVNATDNKNYIVPKALVRELSRTWDQVLAEKDIGFITIDDGRLTVQFVLEWMKSGGCDNPAPGALQYPAGSSSKLESLGRLAGRLGIDELVKRVNTDLEMITKTAIKTQESIAARQAAQVQQTNRGRVNSKQTATQAQKPNPALQTKLEQRDKRSKTNMRNKREPQSDEQRTKGRKSYGGKRQGKKPACQKCGDPRHNQSKCPVGWSDATDGTWKYVPRKNQAFASKAAGQAGNEQATDFSKAKDGVPVERSHMKRLPAQQLEHTAGELDNFQLMEPNGTTWFVPWYKIKVRFETVPGSGKLRIVGDAPLEYSWIPADINGGNSTLLDSDSSHKA